jgi:hypothetical protein
MTHLTDLELVDLVESNLDAGRERHVDQCDHCRARARDLREALASVAGVDMPEPSPLFWQHLSTRVMAGIAADEAGDGGSRWFGWRPRAWAAAAVLLLLAAGLVTWSRPTTRVEPTAPAAATVTSADDSPLDLNDDLNADEGWAVVRSVADGANWKPDDAHEAGVAPAPGWVDTAAWSLNAAELTELARLLEDELKRDKGV